MQNLPSVDQVRVMTSEQERDVEKRKREAMNRQIADEFRKTGFMVRHVSQHRMGYPPPPDTRQYAWEKKLELLIQTIRVPGAIVALIGPRGTGKTQMACAAAYAHVARRLEAAQSSSCMYCRVLDFFVELKSTYGGGDAGRLGDERMVINSFTSPHLLVLDEVQVRNNSAWESTCLTHLLDSRYGDCKSTILISNLMQDDLAASMGDSIMDRLTETGRIIVCDWPSFREFPK